MPLFQTPLCCLVVYGIGVSAISNHRPAVKRLATTSTMRRLNYPSGQACCRLLVCIILVSCGAVWLCNWTESWGCIFFIFFSRLDRTIYIYREKSLASIQFAESDFCSSACSINMYCHAMPHQNKGLSALAMKSITAYHVSFSFLLLLLVLLLYYVFIKYTEAVESNGNILISS